jgi:HTH-type transcriptional regulator/antitoxin HipB
MQFKDAKEFGEMVRQSRKKIKLTQAKLAAATGLGERFIRELEKGKPSCQLEKSLRVAALLGIKFQVILPPTADESK